MSSPVSSLRDAKYFTGLSFAEDDNNDTTSLSAAGLCFATASEARAGKHCLIQGFPCRIRDIQRSAPGKHGHAKLRVVGVGILDLRKREAIFGSHQQVLIPTVETRSNILAVHAAVSEEGYELEREEGLPKVLSFSDNGEEKQPRQGTHLLTVVISCGHFRVTGVNLISQDQANKLRQNQGRDEASAEEKVSSVLSKKEQRKQRKALKKQAQ